MERSLVFATPHFAPIRYLAPLAENHGFRGAWFTEYPDRDAIVQAVAAGCRTDRIRVGTGIAYSFTRHPVALAAAAVSAHEATRGRFSLGLGTGTDGMRRRWFGVDAPRPVAALRETVQLLRAYWESDGDFVFEGERVSANISALHVGPRLAHLPALPIMGSGLGPRMVTGAASWCDGLLLHPLAVGRDYEERTLAPSLAKGLQSRSVDTPFRQVQWVLTSVDRDSARAAVRAKRSLAFYLCTKSYSSHFSGTRWEQRQLELVAAFQRLGPRWDQLGDLVPAEMVREYCVAGSPDAVASELAELEGRLLRRGVDEIVLQVATTGLKSADTNEAMMSAIEFLSPE